MGAVGGLIGMAGGMGGTGFGTTGGTNGQQLNTAYTGSQNSMDAQKNLLNALQQQNGIGSQSLVNAQLQDVVNGRGPNPAQAMLNEQTGQNVANQAALMAGQRGAGANVGLMARQNAQQGANLQQQAIGQGASMQAQQSLGALGQAGNMANTMAANQIGQTNSNTNAQQNEQNILQGANTASNNIQGQMANTRMGGQQAMLGGLGNAAGAISGLFADGGAVGNAFEGQSMFSQFLSNPPAQTPTFSQYDQKPMFGNEKKQKTDKMAVPNAGLPAAQAQFNTMLAPNQASSNGMDAYAGKDPGSMFGAAGGGKVPAMVSPGERFLNPNEAKAVSQGKVDPMQVGETIPGQAKVKGDSLKNDIVKKDLDVGGIVLPRSITQSKNPGKEAKAFVDAYMAKQKVKK